MTMRAIVLRNIEPGTDPDGGKLPPVWQQHAIVPCRAWSRAKKVLSDTDKGALLQDLRCAFPAGADVSEADRVARIEDRRGTLLFDGPMSILTLQRRPGHIEAMLERVH